MFLFMFILVRNVATLKKLQFVISQHRLSLLEKSDNKTFNILLGGDKFNSYGP